MTNVRRVGRLRVCGCERDARAPELRAIERRRTIAWICTAHAPATDKSAAREEAERGKEKSHTKSGETMIQVLLGGARR